MPGPPRLRPDLRPLRPRGTAPAAPPPPPPPPPPPADPAPAVTPARPRVEPPEARRAGPPITPRTPEIETPPRVAAPIDPLADPEPPFSSEVPASITDPRARAAHLGRIIHAHVVLREKTYYDSGLAIAELMKLKHVYGAADIKELCVKAGLPMSHMTAQKHLMIARTFDRATALRHRSQKCYALLRYAVVTGRREADARTILARNETLEGVGIGAESASAAQVSAAIAFAEKARAAPDPAPSASEREAAEELQGLLRGLGLKGIRIRVDDDGELQLKIRPDAVRAFQDGLPAAIARWAKHLAKVDPARFAPFVRAGWKPKA